MQYLARGAAEPCAIPAGPRCGIRRLNGFGGVLKIDALTRRRLETGRNGQRWLSRGLKNAVDLAIWVTEGSQLSVQKRWGGTNTARDQGIFPAAVFLSSLHLLGRH